MARVSIRKRGEHNSYVLITHTSTGPTYRTDSGEAGEDQRIEEASN